MTSKISVGSIVYGSAGIGCRVLAIAGDTLTIETAKGIDKISLNRVLRVEAPVEFYVGDRVTVVDKYHCRGADIGTVELIEMDKIQVLWDTEPQPPSLWRTFAANELELIERKDCQNCG